MTDGSHSTLDPTFSADDLRDVYRAASALICLGRWLHRVPT
jgi:hypothetical protein